jgi:D-alanyl-D-alanine carboxypeptidase/D-alanyl-D-alanine-endopeptidase (penicillin-binding protein 4)
LVEPFNIAGKILLSSLILTGLWLTSCHTSSSLTTGPVKSLNKVWNELHLAEEEHVGLYIMDIQSGKKVFGYRDDNYFIPASNTKILTMYAALSILKDKIEAGRYVIYGDSLVIWGGGDPGSKYTEIDSAAPLVDFIKTTTKKVFFSTSHFQTERFGQGWAWDDYPYTFQCERNAFPILGNRLWIKRRKDTIDITPAYLLPVFKFATDTVAKASKSEWGEGYTYTYDPRQAADQRQVPITFFKNDIQHIWSEVTGKSISMETMAMPAETMSIAGSPRDTLLKRMMQESDNFIAEQLLLACAFKKVNYMAEDIIIDSLMQGPLLNIPDDIKWIDGSGLSRYNQMTPRSIVWVLGQIYDLEGMNYIKSIFPAGGVSGNIKDLYQGKNGLPYIYAKTGTMQHISCISGFLLTRSGKILVFSWMNNQFMSDPDELKGKMEKLFSFLCDHY